MTHGNYEGVVEIARNGVDEVIRLEHEVERLQEALYFWLPSVARDGNGAMNDRIASDAGLLYGLALPPEKTAEELGWISVATPGRAP